MAGKTGFCVSGLLVSILALAACSKPPGPTDEFLSNAWVQYRHAYIDPAGFTLDRTRNGGEVTSEGQSYALLRAAWMNDRPTFDLVLAWTDRELLRDDGLFAWRWSPRQGVIDANSAADADQDIAFALIIAAHNFGHRPFLDRAKTLLTAIRQTEAVTLPGGWFPAAGNWATGERIVNLSYFAPYAYPYFDRIDPEGRWLDALRTGYALLGAVEGVGMTMPPDFMTVDAVGRIGAVPAETTLGRTFSYDAIRLVWKVALDCRLFKRAEACDGLRAGSVLASALLKTGRVVTSYGTDGTPMTEDQSPTFYACLLPFLDQRFPELARTVRADQLAPDTLEAIVASADRYYDQNWIWFGLAAADGLIDRRTPALDAS